jgi:hypothetical protein
MVEQTVAKQIYQSSTHLIYNRRERLRPTIVKRILTMKSRLGKHTHACTYTHMHTAHTGQYVQYAIPLGQVCDLGMRTWLRTVRVSLGTDLENDNTEDILCFSQRHDLIMNALTVLGYLSQLIWRLQVFFPGRLFFIH